MNSPVALALMMKAKAVFEKAGTFLSCPLGLSFNKQTLRLIVGTDVSRERIQCLSEFSRLVNLLPAGSDWPPTEEHYLWDVWRDILDSAQLGMATRTAEEETKYQEAFEYLHCVTADGSWEDTAQVIAYKQYKDAWYTAQQDYLYKKIDAQNLSDSEKTKWEQVDEPALRDTIAELELAWTTNGFRHEVDEARRIEGILADKSPVVTWTNWQKQFQPDIDVQTDLDNSRFVATGYAPSNAMDALEWQQFKLSLPEVKLLVTTAPSDLRSRLVPDEAADLEVESLSFEYTSVGITRPWFVADVFTSRFWKFYDSTKALSDGCDPPRGLCPAYVTGLVFARNLMVRPRAQSSSNPAVFETLRQRPLFVGCFPIHRVPSDSPSPAILRDGPPQSTQSVRFLFPRKQGSPVAPVALRVPASRTSTAVLEDRGVPADISRVQGRLMRLQNAGFKRPPVEQIAAVRRLVGGSKVIREAPAQMSPEPSGSLHSVSEPSISPTEDQSIYILAFICKRVPKCPDPDPNLKW